MSLVGETIATWDQMKHVFLGKYQEYCRTKDKREELFKMVQKDDESLEDFVERIMYNVQEVRPNHYWKGCPQDHSIVGDKRGLYGHA